MTIAILPPSNASTNRKTNRLIDRHRGVQQKGKWASGNHRRRHNHQPPRTPYVMPASVPESADPPCAIIPPLQLRLNGSSQDVSVALAIRD
jgi:hypothetical protein